MRNAVLITKTTQNPIDTLIKDLKKSNLYAECSVCGEEFRLSKTILFDGTQPFPEKAIPHRQALIDELDQMKKDLAQRKKRATEGAQVTTKAVNIGKQLEKILPLIKGFTWECPDCRFLSDPIDLIIFNGLTQGNIQSIDFVEVKTGTSARLNPHQKLIRDAVEDKRVIYRVF